MILLRYLKAIGNQKGMISPDFMEIIFG